MKLSKWLSGAMVAAGLVSAVGPAFAQEKLTVWWVKGFYKAEDDALFAAIRKFEEKNKNIIDFMKVKNYSIFADTYVNTIFVDSTLKEFN